ncbi:hypothetical protein lerEdw1_019484 [Lerista edwardsae]|nr:hypothetical protein lerEdw1_019484 [Lerista edwardsae]
MSRPVSPAPDKSEGQASKRNCVRILVAMLWVLAVFVMGVFASGSRSEVIVTQQSAMVDSLGSTVKIPCTVAGLTISSERVRWYQQKPDDAPSFLYHYYSSSDQGRGSEVPERFSVSPDASSNLWNLVISGVQAEDEADYYCCTWDSGRTMHHSDSF